MANTYIVYNGPMVTTAAPVSVTTGTAIKTLLQIKPAANFPLSVVEWGISFDGSAAATPGKVELIDTGAIFATVTSFAAADCMPYNDPNAPANTTAGAASVPLNMTTTASGYTSTGEGTITATRELDLQLLPPTGPYVKQFPLGQFPKVIPGNSLRVRVHFAAAINALCYVVFEV